jgi:hypothetical protein
MEAVTCEALWVISPWPHLTYRQLLTNLPVLISLVMSLAVRVCFASYKILITNLIWRPPLRFIIVMTFYNANCVQIFPTPRALLCQPFPCPPFNTS